MRHLLLLFLLGFGFEVSAQQHISLSRSANGYIYTTDTTIIIKDFGNGLVPFMIKYKDPYQYKFNRVGFADSAGNIRVEPGYINGSPFKNGQALVQDTGGKVNVIDTLGNLILPAFYDLVVKCDNGLFVVSKNRRLGLFTSSGKQIFPPDRYTRFAQRPTVIRSGERDREFNWRPLSIEPYVRFTNYIAFEYNGLWGVINREGTEIIPPGFEEIGVFTGDVAVAVKNKKSGLIDYKGKWLIPALYDKIEITPYKTVLVTQGKKMGALSIKNKPIVPIIYDNVRQLTAKAFRVFDMKEDEGERTERLGIINNKGKVVIPIAKQQIDVFGNGFVVGRFNDTPNGHLPYAVYNNHGKRISAYSDSWYPLEQLWRTNDPADSLKYLVFNAVKNKFIAYTAITDYFEGIDLNPRVISYQKNKRWGLLNEAGVEVTQAIYDDIKAEKLGYKKLVVFARRDGKWGVIDNKGNVLLNFEYDAYGLLNYDCYWLKKGDQYCFMLHDVRHLSASRYDKPNLDYNNYYSNLIPVQGNGKWGFLDVKGHELIPCIYEEFGYSGDAIAVKFGSKWGFLDYKGHELIPCIYDELRFAQGRNDDLIKVRIGNKWGFLDKQLKALTEIKYDEQQVVHYYEKGHRYLYSVSQNHKYGMVDAYGKEIVPCIYDQIQSNWYGTFTVIKNKLYGVLSSDGKILVEPEYQALQILEPQFEPGHRWYRIVKNGKTGLMNQAGQIVIPCLYTEAKFDRPGNFAVQKNGKWGMISLKSKVIIPFSYESVDELRWHQDTTKWVYMVKLKGKYGLVDAGNKMILPFKYEQIEIAHYSYDNTGHPFIQVTVNGKSGLLNWGGKIVVPLKFKFLYDYPNNYQVVGTDDKAGLLDLHGKQVLAPVYDFISNSFKNYYWVSKGKRINVVGYDGKPVFDKEFDSYDSFFVGYNDNWFRVIRNGKYGLLDCEANLIYPCIYKSIRYEDGKIITEKF